MKLSIGLENVTQTFIQGNTSLKVLQDITITFTQGLSYALTGISGSGKSTLLALLAGFEKPTQGQVLLNGHQINHFSEKKLQEVWLYQIGFLFQMPYLSSELTVLENVILKGLIAGKPLQECREKGMDLLKRVGLAEKADQAPTILSGGEQQRVALVRAVFLNPAFLIADEPTAHLDETTKMPLIALLREYQQEHAMGLILSSHDVHLVAQMDEIYELRAGSLQLLKRNM
ncbi:MAG: ATP-binding cassette domain-containing protein [Candidatus Babeliaceae bacterium]